MPMPIVTVFNFVNKGFPIIQDKVDGTLIALPPSKSPDLLLLTVRPVNRFEILVDDGLYPVLGILRHALRSWHISARRTKEEES